jgi:hypothetical protein
VTHAKEQTRPGFGKSLNVWNGAPRAVSTRGTFEIICECALEECRERIEISFERYEGVREEPATFVVVPGDIDTTCERVVAGADSYRVVEKFGVAGAVAEMD